MLAMTSYERVKNSLECKSVDQLPFVDAIWPETFTRWIEQGHVPENQSILEHFSFDICRLGGLNCQANLDKEEEILEENDESIIIKDRNGATLKKMKSRSGTPEHIDFSVKNREDWEEKIKPHLVQFDRRRIPFKTYRSARTQAKEKQIFLTFGGLLPFEQMHPVCGHEYLLMGMALDPEWVNDMVKTYVELTINHCEVLFYEEGLPDAVWMSEDLGFKGKPFMSPEMYEAILLPGHKRLFDFFHSKGLKVIVHSCGFVEPLVPGLIKAGMDCLQAMEAKAGMDMPRLFKQFGDKISFCGNIDAMVLLSNDKEKIAEEVKKKVLPIIQNGGGYILHSDHSIPPQVNYETFNDFAEWKKNIMNYK